MEVVLGLNGLQIVAHVDEQEQMMLRLAAGELTRDTLEEWLHRHTEPTPRPM